MPPNNDGWTPVSAERQKLYKEKPSALWDMVRATPGGLAQGATGLVGAPSTVLNLLANQTGRLVGREQIPDDDPRAMTFMGIPTTGQLDKAVTAPFRKPKNLSQLVTGEGEEDSGYYQPKTLPGKIWGTGMSFLPGGGVGAGSRAARLMTNVAAPATAMVMAGEAVGEKEHPYLHTLAELSGAIAGGSLANVARIGSNRISAALAAAQEAGDIQAMRKFQELLAKAKMSPDSIQAGAMPAARGQTVAEAMGPRGVTMAATLARQEGEAGPLFDSLIRERNEGRAGRIMGETEQASGVAPQNAANNIKDIVERGQQRAAPLFKQAEDFTPVPDEHLDRLAQNARVQKGMRSSIRNDRDVADARNVDFDPASYAVTEFNAAGDPVLGPVPKWKTWFAGKRGLDDQLEKFRNPHTREIEFKGPAYAIDQLRRGLVDRLKDLNPHYREALKVSGDYLSTNTAFKDARNHLLDKRIPAAQTKTYFEKLSAADQEAYRHGLSDKIGQMVNNAKNFRPDALLTPNIKTKLRIAFGDKADEFITAMEHESELIGSGGRIRPGSGSFTFEGGEAAKDMGGRLKDAQALSEGAQALALMMSGPHGWVPGALGAAKAGIHFIPNKLQTGGMNVEGRNHLSRMLAMSPEELRMTMAQLPPKPKVDWGSVLRTKSKP